MSESATNINELPVDPGISNASSNIVLETKEKNNIADSVLSAANAGLTSLPSRDIPSNPIQHSHDISTTPNYVPESDKKNFIENFQNEKGYENKVQRERVVKGNLDILFDEFHLSALVGLLYFLFQLPIFKSTMYKLFGFLFKKDGNYNLGGYISVSVLFGLAFYAAERVIEHFSI
tara:strand:- start:4344 stop:4871 length:528 start_codon:yes stop_codon:yes gene_type:complete